MFGVTLNQNQEQPRAQLIFQGTTTRVVPAINEADHRFVFTGYSANHWATPDTTKEYLLELVEWRKRLNKPPTSKILLVWDVFYAHRERSVLDLASLNNIIVCYVIAGRTGQLQLCDVSLNKPFKNHTAKGYQEYAVACYDNAGPDYIHSPSMRELRELCAKLVSRAFQYVCQHPTAIVNGAKHIGIDIAIDRTRNTDAGGPGQGDGRGPVEAELLPKGQAAQGRQHQPTAA